MTGTNRIRNLVRAAVAALAAMIAAGAQAQSYFDSLGFFPSPRYVEQDPLVTQYTNGFLVRGLVFTLTSGRIAPPPAGFLTPSFNVTHLYDLSPPGGPFSPVSGSGNGVARITFDHLSGTTQVYTTEMLALNLSGGPAMVRESPTIASTGGFTRTPSGGGWQVDSFFDIFTEMSLDGGVQWSPSLGATRFRGVPEPCSLLAFGVGASLLGLRKRKKAS